MKLFINDWDGNTDTFAMGVEENREYPVNAWVALGDGKQIYLASVYVYDEFVMFFYIYTIDLMREYMEYTVYEIPKTNHDWAKQSRDRGTIISLEYEVNSLKSRQGSSGGCLPAQMPDDIPEEDMDAFTKMHYEEYDYLFELMKERIPKELKGSALAFRKDCYNFDEPVDKIERFAIFPYSYESYFHFIDKKFVMPFGSSDIKIEYPAGDAQSYVVLQELKVCDMLEAFEAQYDEMEKAHKESLLEWEKRGKPANESVMSMEGLRAFYDKRLLVISYLTPEEHRSFDFYLKEYLDAELDKSGTGQVWLYSPDEDDKLENGLYKRSAVLCEMLGDPEAEYEITLMWAVDSMQNEHRAVFEMTF